MTHPPGPDPYGNPTPQSPDSPGWGRSGGYPRSPEAGWGSQHAHQQSPTGYEQQSVYPPPVGAQQAWPGQRQPGYSAQPGYPGGFPPPRRTNTVLIATGIAGVVVVVVAAVALVIVLNRHSGSNTASPVSPSLVPATSSSSEDTTTTTPAAGPPGRFSYTEYAHDWNFGLGNGHLHADWVSGQDHPTCADIENDGKLTALGCQYAAEMVYRAEGGGLMLTQYVLGTADSATAGRLATQYTDADLKMRPGTYIDNFAVGKWQTKAQGNFVVLTVVTATNAVTEDTATEYLHYLEADMAGALLFR